MTHDTVIILLPEILLIAIAVAIYMGSALRETQRGWNVVALVGVIAAGCTLAVVQNHAGGGYALIQDNLALFARWLTLALALVYILMSFKPLYHGGTPELFGSLLLVIAGTMLTAAAADLVLIFVSLELISIPTYILLYLGRRDALQQESATKYFYLSVLSSAVMLYGFSFLYGVAGTTNLQAIHDILSQTDKLPQGFAVFAKLATVLIIAGLSFRLTAVPFHFYAPDVYQGTTHANAALLSVIPKLAGLAILARIVFWAMPDAEHIALWIIMTLAVLSMTFGNMLALWQDNLRRLMAYSSIAHAGYLLIGLAVALATGGAASNSWDGIGAIMFYLCVYAAATLGAFAVFEHLGRHDRRLEGIDELAGLGRMKPAAAAMLAVFLFSLTGIPPLAGFWGKFQIFGSALSVDAGANSTGQLHGWFIALAIIGVLNAAVSAAYYLRIVAVMYFRSPLGTPRAEGGLGSWLAAVLCCLLTLGLSFYPAPLLRESNRTRPEIKISTPNVGQVSNLSSIK
jgi:NADH-quinone oxidoreductase subunit N